LLGQQLGARVVAGVGQRRRHCAVGVVAPTHA
jgi:hypothetical protein